MRIMKSRTMNSGKRPRPQAGQSAAIITILALLLAVISMVFVSEPIRKTYALSSGGSLLAAPVGEPGSDPGHINPVLLYEFTGADPLSPLTPIPPTPATSVNDPIAVAFSTQGELFVANRHGNVLGGVGSISRFTFDASGNFSGNGTITGNSLEAVHGLAFSPTGELFAANLVNGKISRFLFDSSGAAVANGTMASEGALLGLAFSPSGELFVTHSSDVVHRYLFDSGGAAIPNGSFVVPGSVGLHFLGFSPWGELFIPDIYTNNVFRYVFDGSGNPVSNGTIFAAGGPIGVAFSPDGELFISMHFAGAIARMGFDGSGNPQSHGFITTPPMGDIDIFSSECADPPTISNASTNPSVLWPPNHHMVDVQVSYDVTDDCDSPGDVTCALSVASNEPVNGTGDGDSAPDWEVVDPHHVKLRAERSGEGEGRTYTITITCTDGAGNSSSAAVTVAVPKSMK